MAPYPSCTPPSTIWSARTAAAVGHFSDGCSGGDTTRTKNVLSVGIYPGRHRSRGKHLGPGHRTETQPRWRGHPLGAVADSTRSALQVRPEHGFGSHWSRWVEPDPSQ